MIEVTLKNAFYIVVKLTWEYGFPKLDNVSDVGYKVISYLIQKPNITTCLISFVTILGTISCSFTVIILLGVLCLCLFFIIFESLVLIIIIIISCQGLTVFILSYICTTGFISWYKTN